MKELLFEVAAPVTASAEQVRELFDTDWILRLVLAQQEADRTGAVLAGDPERPVSDQAAYVDIDRAPGRFGIQGHWWYRGEWTVDESPDGVRIVYRVLNIARSHRWAVPLANRMFVGYRRAMQAGLDQLAQRIDQQLSGAPRP